MEICKKKFQSCKKFEDSSLVYVYKCKTSSNNLKSTLNSLYNAKSRLTQVKNKVNIIANQTASKKRSVFTSNAALFAGLQSFLTKVQSLDVDSIGTDSTVKSLTTDITTTNVYTFTYTSVQISSASSFSTSITTIIVKVCFWRVWQDIVLNISVIRLKQE